MVFCTPAAVSAAGAAASGGATALGLNFGKETIDITREAFFMGMRQSKRQFVAQWAEASYRHGEAIAQAAQQHSEAQALASAAYYQAERIHSEGSKLARDMDIRNFEMSWRTEARESLRDELANQINRYNTIMLCDTVCLASIYYFLTLNVEEMVVEKRQNLIIGLYLFCMGSSIMLFSLSIFFCLMVTQRLYTHTAWVLERKLFAENEELQESWRYQIEDNLPTPTDEMMYQLNQAYQQWLSKYIHPMGKNSAHMMYNAVLLLFVVAGILTQSTFNEHTKGYAVFWCCIGVTVVVVFIVKSCEERLEKTKQGVYDKSYLDTPGTMGTMAKIKLATEEIYSPTPVYIGSHERREKYKAREEMERAFISESRALHAKANCLLQGSQNRTKAKNDVLNALTAATEELDALPEDLIARLNHIIHDIDNLDQKTAACLDMPSKYPDTETSEDSDHGSNEEGGQGIYQQSLRPSAMTTEPIDAQRTAVSLPSLRMKLGEIPLTTLIRIRNLSQEPLRLKSGLNLKDGQYIKEIVVLLISNKRSSLGSGLPGSKKTYQLYPISEIPPRTEVAIVARSRGTNWIPTSAIEGEIVFANKSESWAFRITFSNRLTSRAKFNVQAISVDKALGIKESFAIGSGLSSSRYKSEELWQASHETIDGDTNFMEVLVNIDKKRKVPTRFSLNSQGLRKRPSICKTTSSSSIGPPTRQFEPLNETDPWIAGYLGLEATDLQGVWQEKWCTLTSRAMTVSSRIGFEPDLEILVSEIERVHSINEHGYHIHKNVVFEIYRKNNVEPIRFSAAKAGDRDKWIRKITDVSGRHVTFFGTIREESPADKADGSSSVNGSLVSTGRSANPFPANNLRQKTSMQAMELDASPTPLTEELPPV